MPRFLTLGPDTNHDFATRRYLDFHRAAHCPLTFVENPAEGFEAVIQGATDFFVLCSVHPKTARLLCDYAGRAFIVDTFISASKPLAIVSRAAVAEPKSLGLFAATIGLAPTARWRNVIVETEGTLATVGAHLRGGKYDSALTYRDFAERHRDELRVESEIESPDDAWLVLGRRRATGLVADTNSVVSRVIAAEAKSSAEG